MFPLYFSSASFIVFLRSSQEYSPLVLLFHMPLNLQFSSVQFISVTQSSVTLCNPMDCRMPGFPVHHQLPELAQTHVHRVSDAILPILSSVVPFSSCLQSFPASGSFPMNQLFASGGQNTRASASASVLSMNIQD